MGVLIGHINCVVHGKIQIVVEGGFRRQCRPNYEEMKKARYTALCPVCRSRYEVKLKGLEASEWE